MIAKLFKNVREWSEMWSLPFAVILWFVSPTLMRWVDPTAGSFDVGYIQKLVLAMVFMLAVSGFSWLGIKFNFPDLFHYGDDGFETDFKNLTAWQKISLYLFVPLFYMFLLTVLIVTL